MKERFLQTINKQHLIAQYSERKLSTVEKFATNSDVIRKHCNSDAVVFEKQKNQFRN